MNIIILGGDGMLGHQLLRRLGPQHQCKVTLRGLAEQYSASRLFDGRNSIYGVDVSDFDRVEDVLREQRPQVVINAVGIVKQRSSSKEAIPSLEINSLLPHRLAQATSRLGARLVHFSTDCVFSGEKGNYSEVDRPDANDLYGRTKLLGEVSEAHCLTLRTSIIGRELSRKGSLLEWLLAQRGQVKGFRKAIYSGFTTIEMARIVERMLVEHPTASGIWHVSSEPIDKCSLLELVHDRFGLDTVVIPDDTFVCDRSLDSDRFRARFGYVPPSWPVMIGELAADRHFYDNRD